MDTAYGTVPLSHENYGAKPSPWQAMLRPGVISVVLGVTLLVFLAHRQQSVVTSNVPMAMEEQVPLGGTIITITPRATVITVYLPMQPSKTIHVNSGFISMTSSANVKATLLPSLKQAKALQDGPPFATVRHSGSDWNKLSQSQKAGILQGTYEALKEAGFQYMPQWFNFDEASTSPSTNTIAQDRQALLNLEKAKQAIEQQLKNTEAALKEQIDEARSADLAQLSTEQQQLARGRTLAFQKELERLKQEQKKEQNLLDENLKAQIKNVSGDWEARKAAARQDQQQRQALVNQTDDVNKQIQQLIAAKKQEVQARKQVESANRKKEQALKGQFAQEWSTLRSQQKVEASTLKEKQAEERRQFWLQAQAWTEGDWSQLRDKWSQLLAQQKEAWNTMKGELKSETRNETAQQKAALSTEQQSAASALEPLQQKIKEIEEQIKTLEDKETTLKQQTRELLPSWLAKKEQQALAELQREAHQEEEEGAAKDASELRGLQEAKKVTNQQAAATYNEQRKEIVAKWKAKWAQEQQAAQNNASLSQVEADIAAAKKRLSEETTN